MFNVRLLSSNVDRFNIILFTFSLAPFVLASFMAYVVVVVVRNSSNPALIHWQHGGINLSTNAYITSLPLFSSFLLLLLYFPSAYFFADALFHLMSLYIFYISKHCGADAKVFSSKWDQIYVYRCRYLWVCIIARSNKISDLRTLLNWWTYEFRLSKNAWKYLWSSSNLNVHFIQSKVSHSTAHIFQSLIFPFLTFFKKKKEKKKEGNCGDIVFCIVFFFPVVPVSIFRTHTAHTTRLWCFSLRLPPVLWISIAMDENSSHWIFCYSQAICHTVFVGIYVYACEFVRLLLLLWSHIHLM